MKHAPAHSVAICNLQSRSAATAHAGTAGTRDDASPLRFTLLVHFRLPSNRGGPRLHRSLALIRSDPAQIAAQ